jgi:hypothetical protein
MKDPSPIVLGLKWWQAKRGRKGDDEHEHDWEIAVVDGWTGCPCGRQKIS